MSSVLIKFKIDYKNKKTLVQKQPITYINEIKKESSPISRSQQEFPVSDENFPESGKNFPESGEETQIPATFPLDPVRF